MDTDAVKKKAEAVEREWEAWLNGPATFPPSELLDAWGELLEEALGKPPVVDMKESDFVEGGEDKGEG